MGIGDGASARVRSTTRDAHADAAVFLDDALGFQAGNTGGHNVLGDDAALAPDGCGNA